CSYGAMVGEFLSRNGMLKSLATVCEAGGGYGSLMYGLLESFGASIERVCMIDLSSGLLRRQRRRLEGMHPRISFIRGDIQELIRTISGIDLFIANEVMGDLDTLTGIDPSRPPKAAAELIEAYGLDIPQKPFNLNIGALKLVEALCVSRIPAFLSEHSSDPVFPPDMAYLAQGLELDSYPREIRLRGHSDYTIRFSHLERIARAHGRSVSTGSLLEIVPVKRTRSLETIFRMRACDTEEHEIVYELLDHIREYRWLTIR
ncbi:MAG: class I SAM-dependent methyltransferase, partial [Desulfomonilia bacterium]